MKEMHLGSVLRRYCKWPRSEDNSSTRIFRNMSIISSFSTSEFFRITLLGQGRYK